MEGFCALTQKMEMIFVYKCIYFFIPHLLPSVFRAGMWYFFFSFWKRFKFFSVTSGSDGIAFSFNGSKEKFLVFFFTHWNIAGIKKTWHSNDLLPPPIISSINKITWNVEQQKKTSKRTSSKLHAAEYNFHIIVVVVNNNKFIRTSDRRRKMGNKKKSTQFFWINWKLW